jgi:hypothetical protein
MRMPDNTVEIRQWELTQKGGPYLLTAERIGHASSRRSDHNHPTDQPYEPHSRADSANRKPCHACYWTEVKIFRTHGEGNRAKYVVYTAGGTSVPGATTFSRLTWTDAHHEVLEVLIDRSSGRPPTMTATTARAMAQAASKDPDIEHAWINRALP